MASTNWLQVAMNIVASGSAAYMAGLAAGGSKTALLMMVSTIAGNLAALFQTPPHKQNGTVEDAIAVLKDATKK